MVFPMYAFLIFKSLLYFVYEWHWMANRFLKFIYTNLGFVYHLKKSTWDLVYPADFRDTQEIREILLVGLGDWNLKNTDFSRKIPKRTVANLKIDLNFTDCPNFNPIILCVYYPCVLITSNYKEKVITFTDNWQLKRKGFWDWNISTQLWRTLQIPIGVLPSKNTRLTIQ